MINTDKWIVGEVTYNTLGDRQTQITCNKCGFMRYLKEIRLLPLQANRFAKAPEPRCMNCKITTRTIEEITNRLRRLEFIRAELKNLGLSTNETDDYIKYENDSLLYELSKEQ